VFRAACPAVDPGAGRELRHALDARMAVRVGDDLGGLERPLVGTGGEQLELGDELFQTQGGARHLAPPVGRQGPGGVVLVRAREGFPVFGDGVADDDEAHGLRRSGGIAGSLRQGRRLGGLAADARASHDWDEGRVRLSSLARRFAGEVLQDELGSYHRVGGGARAPAV